MKAFLIAIAVAGLGATSAFGADLAVKASPAWGWSGMTSRGFFIEGSADFIYSHRNNATGVMARPLAGSGSIYDAQDLPFPTRGGMWDGRLRVGYSQIG